MIFTFLGFSQLFPACCVLSLLASGLASPLLPGLNLLGPLGSVLQEMEEMAGGATDMMEMAGGATDMAMTGSDMAEAMAPAMTMSFLLPGIGLGLIKGMLLGRVPCYYMYCYCYYLSL